MKQIIDKYNNNIWSLAIFVLAFLQYSNTLTHDFAWDDKIVIESNERVKKGIAGIPKLFLKYEGDRLMDKYGYRPIVLTSFAIEYDLFGNSPTAYHLFNILFYGLLCVLIFKTLLLLFPKQGRFFALLVSILFLVHPLHVEVVANIKSRDELLSMLFAVAALLQLLRFYYSRKTVQLIFCGLLLVMAFLSKESALVFAALLPLSWLYVSLQDEKNTNTLPNLNTLKWTLGSFAAIGGGLMFIWWLARNPTVGLQVNTSIPDTGVVLDPLFLGNSLVEVRRFDYVVFIANVFLVLLLYLKNFFIPYPLIFYYGYNQIPLTDWYDWRVWLSVAIYIFLIGFSLYNTVRKTRYSTIAYGTAFYLSSIALYAHIILPPPDTMADRFMLVPSLGLCIALIATAYQINNWYKNKQQTDKKGKRTKKSKEQLSPLIYVYLLVIIVFSVLSFNRNTKWKNNLTLFENDIQYMPNCAKAHFHLAGEYARLYQKTSNPSKKQRYKQKTIAGYKKALSISDTLYYAHIDLGNLYCNEFNEPNKGIAIFEELKNKYPDEGQPYFYTGYAYLKASNYTLAIQNFEEAIKRIPNRLDTYFHLSYAYYFNGNYDKAEQLMLQQIKKHPKFIGYYDALSDVYFGGYSDETNGLKWLNKALEVAPDNPGIYQKMMQRYTEMGDVDAARALYETAVQRGVLK